MSKARCWTSAITGHFRIYGGRGHAPILYTNPRRGARLRRRNGMLRPELGRWRKNKQKKKGQSRSTRLLGGSTFYGTNVSWSKGVGASTNAWVPVCRVGMEVPWLYLAVLGRDGSGATPGDLIFFFLNLTLPLVPSSGAMCQEVLRTLHRRSPTEWMPHATQGGQSVFSGWYSAPRP